MKKIITVSALCCLSIHYNLQAQSQGNYQYNEAAANSNYNYTQKFNSRAMPNQVPYANNEEIQVSVNGLMNVVADNYVAIFNLVQVGETAETTDHIMRQRVSAFKQQLKKINIDTNDVKVDMISFVPRYEFQQENKVFSKTYNEIPAGFELQKNVSVRFRKSSVLDDIVSAAALAEVYDLVKVEYSLPNIQRSLDSLRLKCIQELKAKTKLYEQLGFRLDTMKKSMADNFITTYPPNRYTSYQAFSRPSLQAAKKKNNPAVNETQKISTRYYAPVEYDQYDLVINPVITEPVVQLSYSLVVKYFPHNETAGKDQYYIISNSGDLKPLKLK